MLASGVTVQNKGVQSPRGAHQVVKPGLKRPSSSCADSARCTRASQFSPYWPHAPTHRFDRSYAHTSPHTIMQSPIAAGLRGLVDSAGGTGNDVARAYRPSSCKTDKRRTQHCRPDGSRRTSAQRTRFKQRATFTWRRLCTSLADYPDLLADAAKSLSARMRGLVLRRRRL